ncbi:4972_t:CDS:1, partial [Funneliformis caledonium]
SRTTLSDYGARIILVLSLILTSMGFFNIVSTIPSNLGDNTAQQLETTNP